MGRRVQYARNYPELFDLLERNQIDVWEVEEDIDRAVYVAGIEHPGYEYGVLTRKLVRVIRHADMSGQDRMRAVIELERERCLDADEPFIAPERHRPSSAPKVWPVTKGERLWMVENDVTSGK